MTPNFVPSQYREVSVASLDVAFDVPLTAERLTEHFLGREVYRRTRYVVCRRGPDTAIVELATVPGPAVMTPAVGVSVLAEPSEAAYVVDPDADTGVPSALAAAARRAGVTARAVVVEGRYHHVNFILDPAPWPIRVLDVVPPAPPKLLDQVGRVLSAAEDLPPVEVLPAVVPLADLARDRPSRRYLVPCRGSGFAADGAEVDFLDERPPRQAWTLIGCSRSRELHRWFYGDLPPAVEMCPRTLAARSAAGVVTLTKCCLLEDGLEVSGRMVVVPWGASLGQVSEGIAAAVSLACGQAVGGSDSPDPVPPGPDSPAP